jgi:hypothetical protein
MSFNICRGTLGSLAMFDCGPPRLITSFAGGGVHSNAARYLRVGTTDLSRAE